MKSIPVNLSALALAFEQTEGKSEHLLDTETGRIVKLNYSRVWDEGLTSTRLLLDADREGRYVAIPRLETRVLVQDMADFANTVRDLRVRKALKNSLVRHRRSHDFIVVLNHYTPEKIRWYAFKDARMRERVLEWMKSIGVSPPEESDRRDS